MIHASSVARTDREAPVAATAGTPPAHTIDLSHELPGLCLVRSGKADVAFYRDVLAVRAAAYCRSADLLVSDVDDRADLLCMYLGRRPVATISVSWAHRGPLDSEAFYPAALVARYRSSLTSAYRFGIPADGAGSCRHKLSRVLVESTWRDCLQRGARLDLINARESMVPYYKRLGYLIVRDSFFRHPVFGTPSYVMLLPASSHRVSRLQALFGDCRDPVHVEELAAFLETTSPVALAS